MKKLPKDTIQLISSGQVITSTYSAVKELFENSIDAKATAIEVKLENYGLKRIEVIDNGCGIPPGEEEFVAKSHYTSKLRDHNDLLKLSSLGFRGEALHSLCSISNLSFSTKTANQDIGCLFDVDFQGNIIQTRPCTRENGVTMIVENLFKNLPVRKQLYNHTNKCKDELRKIEDLLISYGLIMPELRIVLKHNKSIIWQKAKSLTLKDSFISIFGTTCSGQMQEGTFKGERESIKITYILPKQDCNENIFRNSHDRIFIFVNERPVMLKAVFQVIKITCSEYFGAVSSKYPIAFLALNIPRDIVDVNVEPNKSVVLLENLEEIIEMIRKMIISIYEVEKIPECTAAVKKSPCSSSSSVAAVNGNNHIDIDLCTGPLKETSRSCIGKAIEAARCSPIKTSNSVEPFMPDYQPKTPELPAFDKSSSTNDLHHNLCEEQRSLEDHHYRGNQFSEQHGLRDTHNENMDEIASVKLKVGRNEISIDNNERKRRVNAESPKLAEESLMNCSQSLFSQTPDECSLLVHTNANLGEEANDHSRSSEDLSFKKLRKEGSETSGSAALENNDGTEDLDEFFDEDDDILFENDISKSSGGVNLTQLSIDSWSRGVAVKEKTTGEPIQPFQILQPRKNSSNKMSCTRKAVTVPALIDLRKGMDVVKKDLPFSLEKVRAQFKKSDFHTSADDNLHKSEKADVIGQISPWKSWIIRQNEKMYFLNPYRAREVLICRDLLRNYVMPTVSSKISLTKSMLGKRNWETLQNLRFESIPSQTGRYLVDKRITSNGFEIRQRKGIELSETLFEIVKLANVIDEYGILQLVEILDEIGNASLLKEKPCTSLEKYRPIKVMEFLKAESVRLARSTIICFAKDDIKDLVQAVCVNDDGEEQLCLHGKPFIYPTKFKIV